MALRALRRETTSSDFDRLHAAFVQHFGFATAFAWGASAFAAVHAPWVRNFRGLIEQSGRIESTASFLFALPLLMAAAWLAVAFGGETMRRAQMMRNQTLEFGIAGFVAFAVFCLAVQRAVAAYLVAI